MLKATWRLLKHRGTYQVLVRDGRVQKFTRTFKSKAEAVRTASEINRAALTGVELKLPPPKRGLGAEPKLRDALPAFIATMQDQGEWKGGTPLGYLRRLRKDFYDYALPDGRLAGDLRPSELTTPMIGSILDSTRTGPTKRSRAVRDGIRSPLRRYYDWLKLKHDYRGPNPAVSLSVYMGKRESKRQRRSKPYPHFVREDAALVLDVARKHYRRHLAKIGVLLFAGARYGEMAALQKSDILWDKRTIYVQRAWSDKTGRVQDLKNHVCRHIPLSKALAALLREHLDDFPSTGPLLFPGLAATIQWHSSFLEYVWQPLMKKTGLPYRNPHALRHTFATWALEGNLARGIRPEPIARVRDWMGHASIEETERYCHINSMGATDSLDDLYEDLA